jgi:cysteine synthase A
MCLDLARARSTTSKQPAAPALTERLPFIPVFEADSSGTLQESAKAAAFDRELLDRFEKEIWSKTPHQEAVGIVNASPLVDLTAVLKDCARDEYGMDLSRSNFAVFGKSDASLLGGSVKARPAVQILHEAIKTGKLRSGQVLFEATSGNFGIALGLLAKLGVLVVVLVSRKLQEGVLIELEKSDVRTVNLDVDICPAPGVTADPNLLVAKIVAANMRERFSELGLDLKPFDESRNKVEELLGRQDVINLAKLLAEAYGGFCPAQYENELNVGAHETITGPEIDQQLRSLGQSLSDFEVVCAFGTGGTSGGLSAYISKKHGKKSVHVIFPREGQDVAGIRTKSKAAGLRFYQPDSYAGQHEVDFEQAKRMLGYLVKRKVDIGESSALALYAVLQMVNFGMERKFVVVLADGIEKYQQDVRPALEDIGGKEEVSLEEASSHLGEYKEIIWTHPGYVPTEEGVKVISAALGEAAKKVPFKVASPQDVANAVTMQQLPPGLKGMVDDGSGRVLLVCMAGKTSLRLAQVMAGKGIKAQSLTGGMSMLAQSNGRPVMALVRPA